MKRYLNFDNLLLLSSGIIFIISVYFIVNDQNLINLIEKNSSESVANLQKINNDVRIRYKESLKWLPTSKTTKLYNNQLIFSGENSSANVVFNKGSLVLMNSNSLIEVSGESKLSIIEGDINFNIKEPMFIILSGNKINLSKDSKFLVQKSKDKNAMQLTVIEGVSNIETKSGKIIEITKNKQINITENGEFSVKSFSVTELNPSVGEYIYIPSDKDQILSWSYKKDAYQYKVLIANNANLKDAKVLYSKKKEIQIPNIINCRLCYWKVTALGINKKQLDESTINSFSILPNNSPQIISPLNKTVYAIETASKLVGFEWKKNPDHKSFQLRYKHSMSEWQSVTSKTNFVSLELKSNDYTWQIQAKHPDNTLTPWSQELIFKISKAKILLAPKISSPINRRIYFYINEPIKLMINLDLDPKNQASIKEYIVLLSRDKKFLKKNTIVHSSTNQKIEMSLKDVGKYFWKSYYRTKSELKSQETEIQNFSIKAPPILEPIEIDNEEQQINVKSSKFPLIYKIFNMIFPSAHAAEISHRVNWKKHLLANAYYFEFFSDREMSDIIIQKEIKENHIEVQLTKAGVYFWRVMAIDKYARKGKPSKLVKLTVKPKKIESLTAKTLSVKTPFGISKKSKIHLNWEGSKLNKEYKITLLNKKTGQTQNYYSKETELDLNIDAGTDYEWSVEGLDDERNKKTQKQTYPLNTKTEYYLIQPKLNKPTECENKENIIASWSKVPSAKSYNIEMSKDKNFKEIIFKEMRTDTKILIPKIGLKKNKLYYFRVNAQNQETLSDMSNTEFYGFNAKNLTSYDINLASMSYDIKQSSPSSTIDSSKATASLYGFTADYRTPFTLFHHQLFLAVNLSYYMGQGEITTQNNKSDADLTFTAYSAGIMDKFFVSEKVSLFYSFGYNFFSSFFLSGVQDNIKILANDENSLGMGIHSEFTFSNDHIINIGVESLSLSRLSQDESFLKISAMYNYPWNNKYRLNFGSEIRTYEKNGILVDRENAVVSISENQITLFIGFKNYF